MSIKVMTRVWEHADYKESTLLILLALADFADDNGICWPEVPALAAKARVSDRRAIDIIQTLERDGAIVYQRGGGRGHRSLYGILVGLTDEQRERVKLFHRNYFTERKTVKPSARKGEVQRKERVKYSVKMDRGLPLQEASNPDPIRHVDPSSLDPSSSEGAGDFIKALIRDYNISPKKAREIAATGVDPETVYQSIRNCVDTSAPDSMGRFINRVIEAPPKIGKPYPVVKENPNGTHQSNRPRTAHPNAASRQGYGYERPTPTDPDDTG